MVVKCAIYTRVSSERQREKWSLPAQKEQLLGYAKRQGWETKLYDEGVGSGETLTDRPVMMQLLEDARNGCFQVCLVIELERLSRDEDLFDWLTIKQVFRDQGIKMATPNQTYDLSDDEDDFLSDLFGALAKREKKKFLKRAKRGRDEAARRGKYIGSHFALGYCYQKDTGKLAVVPQEAAVVREIFRLCNEENLGTMAIADRLTRKKVPTPLQWARASNRLKKDEIYWRRGRWAGRRLVIEACQWTGPTVHRILTNTRYYGLYHFNQFDKKAGKVRDRSEWISQQVEAIIDKRTYDLAQARLQERTNWRDRNVKALYMLRGLLICHDCKQLLHGVTFKAYEKLDAHGTPLRSRHSNGKFYRLKRWKTMTYYRCYGRLQKSKRKCTLPYIRGDFADQAVWEAVRQCVKEPQRMLDLAFEQHRAILRNHGGTFPGAVQEREHELDRVQKALNRILDAYSYGDLERSDFKRQMEKLKGRQERLESELGALRLEASEGGARSEQFRALEASLADVKGRVDRLSPEEQSELVHAWLTKIVVYPDGGLDVRGFLEAPSAGTAAGEISRAGPGGLRDPGADRGGDVTGDE